MEEEGGYSGIFYVMLIIGIVGVLGFFVGVGGATVLWAACSVSGANAEDERPIDQ
jgi:hypothetical protein